MLGEISQNLELFEIYAETISVKPDVLASFFNVLIDVVLCSAAAIKHFRMTGSQAVTGGAGWGTVYSKFQDTVRDCARQLKHLKSLVQAQNILDIKQQSKEAEEKLLQRLAELNTNPPPRAIDADITLPCRTLPFQRNSKFHGRARFLETMTQKLQKNDENPGIRSVAPWGAGGIGKSQIALEYSHEQVIADVPIVLWVACEKEAEIYKSFDQAAAYLNITGYSENSPPDHTRRLVLSFLERTSK